MRKKALLAIVASCLALLVLESGIRVYGKLKFGTPLLGPAPHPYILPDDHAGWIPRPSVQLKTRRIDLAGRPGEVSYSTDGHGFRRNDSDPEARPRVLFIGDSFTQAAEVSDNKTWHAIIGRELPASIHAIGAMGYGTLQEYYLLDRWINVINPDLVVLQFCPNDFIDNYEPLESASFFNNQSRRRPYLLPTGEIARRRPRDPLVGPLASAADVSRLAGWLAGRVARVRASFDPVSVEDAIIDGGGNHPDFKESVRITRTLLGKFKERCGEVPMVVVSVAEAPVFDETLAALCRDLVIPCITGVTAARLERERQRVNTRAADGAHWNELGHETAARVVIEYLKEKRPWVESR